MILSRAIASRVAILAAVATLINGCMKDNHPGLVELVKKIEAVDQWSRSLEWREHAAWLNRTVAWDIVLVVKMTWASRRLTEQNGSNGADDWAARDLADEGGVDSLLRSGLTEVAAGPGDHAVSLVGRWRQTLGSGRCRTGAASDDDLRWIRERLTLPPPKGAGPESRQALAGYAKRASDTRDVVRVDCGGAAHLLVGVLAGKLVPIMRE